MCQNMPTNIALTFEGFERLNAKRHSIHKITGGNKIKS